MSKIRPCTPTRRCRKKIGPGESSLMAIAAPTSSGEKTSSTATLTVTSKARFAASAMRSVGVRVSASMGSPSMSPTVIRE